MDIKERLKQFIDFKQISYRKFYEKTGLSNSFLSNKSAIGTDKLEKIISVYPEINIVWLFTGAPPMMNEMQKNNDEKTIVSEDEPEYKTTKDELIETLRQQVKDKEKIIELLQSQLNTEKKMQGVS